MVIRSLGVAVLASLVSWPSLADHLLGLPLAVRPCAVCHGEAGVSSEPYIPNLAGQDPQYLAAQLESMRRATRYRFGLDLNDEPAQPTPVSSHAPRWKEHRDNPTMDRQVAMIDDKTIRQVAAYYAAKPRPCVQSNAPRRVEPSLLAHCATCHGRDGKSVAPGIPHLAGQKPKYLIEQLRLFRVDENLPNFSPVPTERSNPIMGPQSALITGRQAFEIADWYASAPCGDRTSLKR